MLTPYAWLQPDNSRLVVGMSDGTLDIRQRVVKVGETVARQQQVRAMHGGSYRYFMRGKSSAADASDYKVCGMPCGLHDSARMTPTIMGAGASTTQTEAPALRRFSEEVRAQEGP